MAIGTTANNYEILSKIAEGGMAELFLARAANATGVRRHVVLKRISRERASDTQYVRMFLDEARLAAQLSHPNIAQVFDIGRLGASYFFTMEYVHGVTVHMLVAAIAERKQRIPVGAVLAILSGAAAALDHAHEKVGPDGKSLGIIHRDVSPSNLMVSYDGHVKLVDFGIAKATGRPETVAGEIKGKVGYMSPEQTRMQRLDRRSDLYSLGICAWEMLTAKRLWKRETLFATLAAIATEPAPPPSIYHSGLAPEVDALVGKLLATEVQDRFQTAREVVDAIEQVARTTRNNLTPTLLARLLRDLFGSPPEPWIATTEPDVVAVLTTPVPPEFAATDDLEEESVSIEAKLTMRFPSVTGESEISTTNVRALPPPPWQRATSDNDDQTREVPSLAKAPVPSVPTSTPGAPTAVMDSAQPLDAEQTLERPPTPRSKPPTVPPVGRSRTPSAVPQQQSERAKRPSVGPPQQQWEPPSQRVKSPSGAPPLGVPPPIIGEPGSERAKRPSAVPPPRPSGPQQWEPPSQRVKSPSVVPPTIAGEPAPRPSWDPNQRQLGLSQPVPETQQQWDPPSQRAKAASVVPATVLGVPGTNPAETLPLSGARPVINVVPPTVIGELPKLPASGPRPNVEDAAVTMQAQGRVPPRVDLPRESTPPVPRWPPPPHGDARLLRWWIIGGAIVGALATLIILFATRDDSSSEVPADAIVVVAKTADAAVADAAVIEDAAADAGGSASIDAPVVDAKGAIDAEQPKPTKSKNDLNTWFRAKKYKEIVAECQLNRAEGEFAQVCTLAACRAHDEHAQDWYRNVASGKRKFMLVDCKQQGHAIEDVCATDGICSQ